MVHRCERLQVRVRCAANPQGFPSQASAVFPSVRSGGSVAQACSDDSTVHSEEVQGKARVGDVSEVEEEVVLFVLTVCCDIGINKREAQLRQLMKRVIVGGRRLVVDQPITYHHSVLPLLQ